VWRERWKRDTSIRAEHDGNCLNKLERLDHLLGGGFVFLEMSGFEMRPVRIHIPVDFKNPDVRRVILFSDGV
jgi:hypothetical protein